MKLKNKIYNTNTSGQKLLKLKENRQKDIYNSCNWTDTGKAPSSAKRFKKRPLVCLIVGSICILGSIYLVLQGQITLIKIVFAIVVAIFGLLLLAIGVRELLNKYK